jgi:hypothetical protein
VPCSLSQAPGYGIHNDPRNRSSPTPTTQLEQSGHGRPMAGSDLEDDGFGAAETPVRDDNGPWQINHPARGLAVLRALSRDA